MKTIRYESVAGHMISTPIVGRVLNSVRYALLVIRRCGFIRSHERWDFLWLERTIGIVCASVVTTILAQYISLFFTGWLTSDERSGLYSIVIYSVMIALANLLPVVLFFWIPLMRDMRDWSSENPNHRYRHRCIGCKYDLDGLESVLGDDIWVGPAVCPECGMEYPAVGK